MWWVRVVGERGEWWVRIPGGRSVWWVRATIASVVQEESGY